MTNDETPSGGIAFEDDGESGLTTSISLLKRAKAGDQVALEEFCARYLRILRRWATGRIPFAARSVLDTDDVIQQTLLETVQRLDVFEPVGELALHSYLRQALLNRIRDAARRIRRNPQVAALEDERPDPAPSPLEEIVGLENLRRYEAALGRLGSNDREAIVARIEMGVSYAEIAEGLGKPTPNSARMAVMRALTRLGEEIARDER